MGGELGDELIGPSIMECVGGRGVRGSTYRSKYRIFSVHYGIEFIACLIRFMYLCCKSQY